MRDHPDRERKSLFVPLLLLEGYYDVMFPKISWRF